MVYKVNPAVDIDSVYGLGVDTPFSPCIFVDFQMGSTEANPKLVGREEDKENSAPTTRARKSERPIEPPILLRSRPNGT